MKILCIGDVVAALGRDFLAQRLPRLKRETGADFVIVNGENAADGNGIDRTSMNEIFAAGANVVTGGNHSLQKSAAESVLEETPLLLRPENLGNTFGHGWCRVEGTRRDIVVLNLQGNLYLPESENAFACAERFLAQEVTKRDIVIVDFHAEATSEKQAMGYFLDGKVSVVFGTHTHVPTDDAHVLPGGTGYVSDIGMTGAAVSVLGKDVGVCVHNFRYPDDRQKIADAKGKCQMSGILCEVDDDTRKCVRIDKITIK